MNHEQTVFVVDDDEGIRDGLSMLLATVNQPCQTFASVTDFLEQFDPQQSGCLVLDVRMPRISGLELQELLNKQHSTLPIIFITGHGDVPMAVEAMRRGALNFIRKPFRDQELLDSINEGLNVERAKRQSMAEQKGLREKTDSLTTREKTIFESVTDGKANKVIAIDLGISERTVEVHRANLTKKLGVRTLADLIHIRLAVDLKKNSA